MRLSVVIPTLNEAGGLAATLQHVRAVPEVGEVVVSDGGSDDATEAIARAQGCRWLSGPDGRGTQLRAGAAVATGDCIVLLHADTWLPPGAGQAIIGALQHPTASGGGRTDVVGGGFHKCFRDGPWLLRSTARWRSGAYFALTGQLLGDQALFVRRDSLALIGGIPPLPLMEEFELCRRLQRLGRLQLLAPAVSTSGRSFRSRGVLPTWWLLARLQIAWKQGASPEELDRQYRRLRTGTRGRTRLP